MSWLNRKVWREFRELDQFDDATCKRIIDVIRKRRPGPRAVAEMTSGAGCIAAFIVPIVLLYLITRFLASQYAGDLDWLMAAQAIMPIVLLGFAPAIGLMIYDRWLRRELSIVVSGGMCLRCGYSLTKLPESQGRITCPECGASHDQRDLLHNLDIEVPTVQRDGLGQPVDGAKRGDGPHGPMW